MPADEVEVTEGAEEGIFLHNSRGPRVILDGDGKVAGLRTVECTAVFDSTGRFNPSFNEESIEDIPGDTVIFSIGQSADLSFLQPGDGVESNRGLIKVDPETYQTTAPMCLRAATLLTARDSSSMPFDRHRSRRVQCTIICAARTRWRPFVPPGQLPNTR